MRDVPRVLRVSARRRVASETARHSRNHRNGPRVSRGDFSCPHFAVETETGGCGLGVKAEELSLLSPSKRQMRETAEPAYRTCDRLAAGKDRLDNVGRQEREPQRSTDIGSVACKFLGQVSYGTRLPGSELFQPRLLLPHPSTASF